ncbi:hypothetical protein ACFX2K_027414 [Malus domestica]
MADRNAGRTSHIMTARRVATATSGPIQPEMSGGGSSIMSKSLGVAAALRSSDSVLEAGDGMAKIVTVKFRWVRSRFASSRTGMRWPRPGLQSMAVCGCELVVDEGQWL